MRDRDAATDRSARTPVRASSLAWTVFAGALLGCCCGIAIAPPKGARFEARLLWNGSLPTASAWPHPARAGERAWLESSKRGPVLVVTAGSAGGARALVRAFATGPAPAAAALQARLDRTRASWRAALSAGPLPERTPACEAAGLLLARARWGRVLAGELPVVPAPQTMPASTPPEGVLEPWREVRRLAAAGEPALLARGLERAGEADARWFADPVAWSGWPGGARAEVWRRWQVVRAAALEDAAVRLLADQTAFQRRLAAEVAQYRLVELDAGTDDPWRTFAAPEPRSIRPLVHPIAAAWLPPMTVSAGVGMLLAVIALLLGLLRAPVVAGVRALRGGAADPAVEGPRLHVVGGNTSRATLRAALELAARRIARGERVLVIDGSARLRLHERLGRDARWGLLECLAADMPMLGLVQYAGHPGLYLLPHGNAERAVGWSPLGRKLDEVTPHFGRIILALDSRSPAALGDSLRGRAMEGWWTQADGRSRKAAGLAAARFGIVFNHLDLSGFAEPTLEVLASRVRALRPAGPAPEQAPITAPAVPPSQVLARAPLEPIVLDCDLQVRQRLRFLAWIRRVQAADRRTALQVTS